MNNAVASAAYGDAVNVPSTGSPCTWTSGITITKGITLSGAGASQVTIITSGSITPFLYNPDATSVLTDARIEISGFTFNMNGSSSPAINIDNRNSTTPIHNVVVHDNVFQNGAGNCLQTGYHGDNWGVVYSNTFQNCGTSVRTAGGDNASWNNTTFAYGSANNLYFEDNTYTGASAFHYGEQGGRYVSRFENFTFPAGSSFQFIWDIHGNQTTIYGSMGCEIYKNTGTINASTMGLDHRGGECMMFQNTLTGSVGSGSIGWHVRDEYPEGIPTTVSNPEPQGISNTYYFLNTYNAANFSVANAGVCSGCVLAENAQYWNYVPSGFNGTVGIGSGTKSQMNAITTCTTGVGFWVTDEGSWNTNLPANTSGQLYKCTSINTWSLYYTPYTYPHPLRSGAITQYTVTASKSGTGSGTLTSSPAGISCGSTCSASFNSGTSVTVNQSTSDMFGGWGGTCGCAGTGSCSFTLNASCTVAAAFTLPVTFTPSSLNFGNQNVGSTSTAQSISLQNTGISALTISSITASGDFAQSNNCPISPSTLAVNSTCTINVTFTPTLAGSRSGTLSVSDNATGSPHTVALSGTGAAVVPIASLSASSLSFGNEQVGNTTAAQSVTLNNTGTAVLNISSVTVTGNFAQSATTCTSTLAAAASCSISITFTPAALGVRSGVLTVTDDSSGVPGSTQTANLSGTGIAAPRSFTFGRAESAKSFRSGLSTCGPPAYSCSNHTFSVVNLAHPDIGPNACDWTSLATLATCGNSTGAGTIVQPNDFGHRIVRITDRNTVNASVLWETADGGINLWNKDDTLILSKRVGTQHNLIHFNPSTFQPAGLSAVVPPLGGDMVFSKATQNRLVVYGGANGVTIQFIDVTTNANPALDTSVTTTVKDMGADANCFGAGYVATWTGSPSSSDDDTSLTLAASNSGPQETAYLLGNYNTVTHQCSVLNTLTGVVTVNGVSIGTIGIPDRLYMHAGNQSPNPAWAVYNVTNQAHMTAGTYTAGYYFWQIGTTNVQKCGVSPVPPGFYCDGHGANGFLGAIRGQHAVYHTYADPSVPLTQNMTYAGTFPDQHSSWNNDNQTDTRPFLYASSETINIINLLGPLPTPFYNEIWLNPTDGTGIPSRQCHTYATGSHDAFEVKYAIASISQTGKYAVFPSDWMASLGARNGAASCVLGALDTTECRSDLFVCELQ